MSNKYLDIQGVKKIHGLVQGEIQEEVSPLTEDEIATAWIRYPKKGEKILINVDGNGNQPFLVLSRKGTVAKVLNQYSFNCPNGGSGWYEILTSNSVYWASSQNTVQYSNGSSYISSSGTIQQCLNYHYNTFLPVIKNAIITTAPMTTAWLEGSTSTGKELSLEWRPTAKIENRDGYYSNGIPVPLILPSVEDVCSFLDIPTSGYTIPTSQKESLRNLFPQAAYGVLLNTAIDAKNVMRLYLSDVYFCSLMGTSNQQRGSICFLMYIDLSKIDFEFAEE